MFTKIANRKVWKRNDNKVFIWLPCDKKTFSLVDRDGNKLSATRFRSFNAAVAAGSAL